MLAPTREIPIEETMMPQPNVDTGTIIRNFSGDAVRIPMTPLTLTDPIRNGEFGKQEKRADWEDF